jgi:hypothetical protein
LEIFQLIFKKVAFFVKYTRKYGENINTALGATGLGEEYDRYQKNPSKDCLWFVKIHN